MTDNPLTSIEQKTVTFYGDELTAVRVSDGKVYVSIRHMCQALGLAQRGQVLRIKRNEILADGYEGGIVMITPGGKQRVGMLRLDLVPLWLASIETSRVKEAIRSKLLRFQKEAAAVLWEAFEQGRLTTETPLTDLLKVDTPAVQAYKTILALLKVAEEQVILEGRVTAVENRLADVEALLGDPGGHITSDQAMQISQSVKTIALVLSKASKSNQYGAVYGEMYRKFGITSYKQLPSSKFDEAMAWLTEWHNSLVGDSPF